MNPFISFCLYVAARIYVHAFKKRPDDLPTRNSLDFLLNAMQAIRKKNALTESFLVQLMVDLEGSEMDNPLNNSRFSFSLKTEAFRETTGCRIFGVDETQPSAADSSGPSQTTHSAPFGIGHFPSNQYSMPTFSVPTREHRTPQQHIRRSNAPPTQLQGLLSGQGWGEKFPGGPEGEAMNSHNMFDTEMSPDHTSDWGNSLSNHPTPTNSNNSSSNTSYSPPHIEDTESTHTSTGPSAAATGFLHPSTSFAGYTPPANAQYHLPIPAGSADSNYVIPPGWEIGPGGVVPSASTGLSPIGESGWTQMLEGMGWDGSALGAGEVL